MPIYEFHCRGCGHEFDALVRPQDQEATGVRRVRAKTSSV